MNKAMAMIEEIISTAVQFAYQSREWIDVAGCCSSLLDDVAGWLMVERARQGHAINRLERPRKCWAAVRGASLQIYDGAKRAGKKPKEYSCKNATCKLNGSC